MTDNINQKEYLFSTSFGDSITELYDIEDFSQEGKYFHLNQHYLS